MTGRLVESPRALLLDFDGVVCDTERAARRSWEELYAESGAHLPQDVWNRMVGTSSGAEVACADLAVRRGSAIRAGELARRLARKRELADREPLCPGVAALVADAVRLGLPVAVVSSSDASWVGHHLARLGLLDLLSFTVTGDEAPRHKPAPDLYLLALRRARVAASDALAVEDSAPGVQAAKAAGLRCVAVLGEGAGERAADGADAVVESLTLFQLAPPEGRSRVPARQACPRRNTEV